MSKINTQEVRNKVVDMLKSLRELVGIYSNYNKKVKEIRDNVIWTDAYKYEQLEQARDAVKVTAQKQFDMLEKNLEELETVLNENDNTYDFSDPEFTSCVALISASPKALPYEMVEGIVKKFLGNKQALLALAEVAKDPNGMKIRNHILNSEAEINMLQTRLLSLKAGFPKDIVVLPAIRDELIKISKVCGEELAENETDLGIGYQDFMNAQMRAAMGLRPEV